MPAGRWLHRDSAFGAVTLEEPGALDLVKLEALFAALFWDPSDFSDAVRDACAALPPQEPPLVADVSAVPVPELYRSKGVIAIAGCSRMRTLQAVHATYEILEGPEWADGDVRSTRIVFIGRNLHRGALTAALRACVASPGPG